MERNYLGDGLVCQSACEYDNIPPLTLKIDVSIEVAECSRTCPYPCVRKAKSYNLKVNAAHCMNIEMVLPFQQLH